MGKSGVKKKRQAELDIIFERANKEWDEGRLKAAFRLFLEGAKGGDPGCQINVGNFCSDGTGVKRDRAAALHWYRRAYRRGHAEAATNIGIVYRDENKLKRALAWFKRAVGLGDVDANLEIAKVYIRCDQRARAVRYLRRVQDANKGSIVEASREEAARLLGGTSGDTSA